MSGGGARGRRAGRGRPWADGAPGGRLACVAGRGTVETLIAGQTDPSILSLTRAGCHDRQSRCCCCRSRHSTSAANQGFGCCCCRRRRHWLRSLCWCGGGGRAGGGSGGGARGGRSGGAVAAAAAADERARTPTGATHCSTTAALARLGRCSSLAMSFYSLSFCLSSLFLLHDYNELNPSFLDCDSCLRSAGAPPRSQI